MHSSAVATQTWVMLQAEFMSWISEYDYSYLNWLQPSYKIPAMYEQPAFSVMVTCTQISSKLPYICDSIRVISTPSLTLGICSRSVVGANN